MADKELRVQLIADDQLTPKLAEVKNALKAIVAAQKTAMAAFKDTSPITKYKNELIALQRANKSAMKGIERGAKQAGAANRSWRDMAKGVFAGTAAYNLASSALRSLWNEFKRFIHGGLEFTRQLEKVELQFKSLLGSMGAAQSRMRDLVLYAAKTPFRLPEIAKASRLMQVFTGNLASAGAGLRLIGDAAAGVGTDIRHVAFWTGRMLFLIEQGRPFGEAALRMQELGLLTGETRARLEEIQRTMGGQDAALRVLSEEWGKYIGLTEELSRTVPGLESTFLDLYEMFSAHLLQVFGMTDAYKWLLTSLNEFMEGVVGSYGNKVDILQDELTRTIQKAVDLDKKIGYMMEAGWDTTTSENQLDRYTDKIKELRNELAELRLELERDRKTPSTIPLIMHVENLGKIWKVVKEISRARRNPEGVLTDLLAIPDRPGLDEFSAQEMVSRFRPDMPLVPFSYDDLLPAASAQKALDERFQTTEVNRLMNFLSGKALADDVDAFTRAVTRLGTIAPENMERVARAAKQLLDRGAELSPELVALANSVRLVTNSLHPMSVVPGGIPGPQFSPIQPAMSRADHGAMMSEFGYNVRGSGLGTAPPGMQDSAALIRSYAATLPVRQTSPAPLRQEPRGFAAVDWVQAFSGAFQGGGRFSGGLASGMMQGLFGEGGKFEKVGGIWGGALMGMMMSAVEFGLEKLRKMIDHFWKLEEKRINDMRDAWKDMSGYILSGTLSLEVASDIAITALRDGDEAAREHREHALYVERLADAFELVGLSAQQALEWERQRIAETNPQVLRGLYAQLEVVGALVRAQDELTGRISDTQLAAEAWGIEMDNIGQKFWAGEAVSMIPQIAKDFQLLTQTGMTALDVIANTSENMIDRLWNLGKASLEYGISIPDALRPAFEALRGEGHITQMQFDDLSFDRAEKNMIDSLDTMIGKIGELIDAINAAFMPRKVDHEMNFLVNMRWHDGSLIVSPDVWNYLTSEGFVPDPTSGATTPVEAGSSVGGSGSWTGDYRPTHTSFGSGGSVGSAASQRARNLNQFQQAAMRNAISGLRDVLRLKEDIRDENQQLLDQTNEMMDAMRLGDVSFSAFDAYLDRLVELDRLTESTAQNLRDMGRNMLLDVGAIEQAAQRFGIDPRELGTAYKRHATARGLEQERLDYEQLLLSGSSPTQIQVLMEQQHKGWLKNIERYMNENPRATLEEAQQQFGKESTLLRLRRLFQDAYGLGLNLPSKFQRMTNAMRRGGGVTVDGIPVMDLRGISPLATLVSGSAFDRGGSVWTEKPIMEQLTGPLADALGTKVADPLVTEIDALGTDIEKLTEAITAYTERLDAMGRTERENQIRQELKDWAKQTHGVDLENRHVEQMLAGNWMYFGTMRGRIAETQGEAAARAWELKTFGRGKTRAEFGGTSWADRRGFGSRIHEDLMGRYGEEGLILPRALTPFNPLSENYGRRAMGGLLNPGKWTVVGENGPELVRWTPRGGSAPMVYSNSASRGMVGGTKTIVVPVNLDGREITRVVIENLPAEIDADGAAA